MAMEINGSYGNYGLDYEEQLRAKRQEKAEEAEKAEKEKEAGKNTDRIPEPRDEYISSEASDRKPTGLYRLGQDENGNPKVLYDDPKKPAREAEEKESAEKKPVDADKDGDPGAAGEKCVGSTDRVDQEIRRLKEQKKQYKNCYFITKVQNSIKVVTLMFFTDSLLHRGGLSATCGDVHSFLG